MDQELMNVYINKQNRLIGDLINKNLMLDSQLEIANQKIAKLSEDVDKTKEDTPYK
jgi:hypothetical protein|tara:strand:- start:1093 stop:1260 length:168 start_codon:yes stop_codon:yes gene_type:complete